MLSQLILFCILSNTIALDWTSFRAHQFFISPIKPRIIGGDEVTPHSYPFQVGLLINSNAFCGGTLISENYVLTAAHCGEVIRTVDVILGAHNITANETEQVIIPGAATILHQGYNRTTYQNDIALIKLSSPAPLNANIGTVLLPNRTSANDTYEDEVTTAIGWGLSGDVDHKPTIKDLSDVLRFVEVSVQSLEDCGDYYNDYDENVLYVTDKNVCTSGYKNKGTCNGDSGGPLLAKGVQIGLVSIGTDLCEMCSPSIFTKVAAHLDWIEANSDVVIR